MILFLRNMSSSKTTLNIDNVANGLTSTGLTSQPTQSNNGRRCYRSKFDAAFHGKSHVTFDESVGKYCTSVPSTSSTQSTSTPVDNTVVNETGTPVVSTPAETATSDDVSVRLEALDNEYKSKLNDLESQNRSALDSLNSLHNEELNRINRRYPKFLFSHSASRSNMITKENTRHDEETSALNKSFEDKKTELTTWYKDERRKLGAETFTVFAYTQKEMNERVVILLLILVLFVFIMLNLRSFVNVSKQQTNTKQAGGSNDKAVTPIKLDTPVVNNQSPIDSKPVINYVQPSNDFVF